MVEQGFCNKVCDKIPLAPWIRIDSYIYKSKKYQTLFRLTFKSHSIVSLVLKVQRLKTGMSGPRLYQQCNHVGIPIVVAARRVCHMCQFSAIVPIPRWEWAKHVPGLRTIRDQNCQMRTTHLWYKLEILPSLLNNLFAENKSWYLSKTDDKFISVCLT